MSQLAIFITGSSSGLGLATAKRFAQEGWRVIATMRNPEKETELQKLPSVHTLRLDLTDPAEIQRTVDEALALGEVDVVFNNAGYGLSSALEGLSDDQIMRMVYTNLVGPIRVTKAFLPHFRARQSGMFINTTSIGGLITVPLNSMYHATKWGLEGWCESMAFELAQFGIGMKIIEPGGMKTDFFGRSLDVGHHPAYDAMMSRVMNAIADPQQMANFSTPEQIAAIVYGAATDGTSQLCYLAGADAEQTYQARQHPEGLIAGARNMKSVLALPKAYPFPSVAFTRNCHQPQKINVRSGQGR